MKDQAENRTPNTENGPPAAAEESLPLEALDAVRALDRLTAWLIKPNVPVLPAADLRALCEALNEAVKRVDEAARTHHVRDWLRDALEGRGINLVPILSQEPCPVCGRGPDAKGEGDPEGAPGKAEARETIKCVAGAHTFRVAGGQEFVTCPLCQATFDARGFVTCATAGGAK
jgi:hypothetical protein